jgi:hypothetical protein
MGKIADAYVEIGARTSKFQAALQGLKGVAGGLLDQITGVGGSAQLLQTAFASGFGKAIVMAGGLAAAVGAVAYAINQLYSRSKDQVFANSVAGATSGFRGLNEQIKFTDEKIKAIMSRDATGGGGGWFDVWNPKTREGWKALAERAVGLETMTSQIARNMDNAATASKLFADNLVRGAIAGREQAQTRRGAEAAAGFRRTAGQQEEMRINAEVFKRVMDEQGGSRVFEQILDTLRKDPSLVPSGMAPKQEAMRLVGALEEGDLAAAKLFGGMFDVAARRAEVLSEEFEEATGMGRELARMEEERIRKAKEFTDAQIKRQEQETQQAAKDMIKLEDQQQAMTERLAQFQQDRADQLTKSFRFSGLAEARDRLFMAAQDAKKDELTASKMQGEIDRVVTALDKLQVKWGMVN